MESPYVGEWQGRKQTSPDHPRYDDNVERIKLDLPFLEHHKKQLAEYLVTQNVEDEWHALHHLHLHLHQRQPKKSAAYMAGIVLVL